MKFFHKKLIFYLINKENYFKCFNSNIIILILKLYIYRYIILINKRTEHFKGMRLLVVLLPLAVALSWALYNIGKLALEQWRRTGSKV